MSNFKNLIVYKKAFDLALRIHQYTKQFPAEERYSLIDQIRRSSRSVCANIAEVESRKRYKDYYLSKLCDCVSENSETEVWLDFSLQLNYLSQKDHSELIALNQEVGKLLRYMINNPEKFL